MRIYLAGRCDTEWRDDILGLKLSDLGLQARDLAEGPWPVVERVIDGKHDYVGAYPVELREEHTNGAETKARDSRFVHNNLAAIDQCDIVFAWIDRHGLYGTVAEVVHAHARAKTVWLAFKTPALELAYWFVSHVGLSPARSLDDEHTWQWRDAGDDRFTAVSAFDLFLQGAIS